MKSVLAGSTQLFTFLLKKTKSYSRQFLEVKGLDQDRGVCCTTILSSIFPLSKVTPSLTILLLNSRVFYRELTDELDFCEEGLCKLIFMWSYFSWIFLANFLKFSLGHWKYPQLFLNTQENNPSDICCTKLQTKYYALSSGFFNWRVQAERLMQA